ncbi:MAG: hypothetical protein OXG98_05680 [Gemmatimonadetes bacterium]|nr:hypothetical protein [Gemmatimonadota bacterium]
MKNLIHAVPAALLTVALIAVGLVEVRWHVIERFVGAYMDARNDSRDRLERFVNQETQTNQALEHANRLIEQRSQVALDTEGEPAESKIRYAPASEIVRLERGHKLIMTRDRFLDLPERLTGTADPSGEPADPPSGDPSYKLPDARPDARSPARVDLRPDAPSPFEPDSVEGWTRTVVIRPGWIRRGEVYLVDDENYILHRMPISVEQFDLIDAYATAADGRMHEDMEHVYGPGMFFETLRSLDMEMRDEIIDPLRFRELEATAQRVGVSENQRIIQIERLVDGRIDVVTIPVSADLFVELYVALGAL